MNSVVELCNEKLQLCSTVDCTEFPDYKEEKLEQEDEGNDEL